MRSQVLPRCAVDYFISSGDVLPLMQFSVPLCANNSLINSMLDVFQRQSAVSVLQFRFSLLSCRDGLAALPGRSGVGGREEV